MVNPVTQQMEMIRARGGAVGFGAPNGSEYAANAHAPVMINDRPVQIEPYAGARAQKRLQNALLPVGQAPLPLEISNNPNYRPRV